MHNQHFIYADRNRGRFGHRSVVGRILTDDAVVFIAADFGAGVAKTKIIAVDGLAATAMIAVSMIAVFGNRIREFWLAAIAFVLAQTVCTVSAS